MNRRRFLVGVGALGLASSVLIVRSRRPSQDRLRLMTNGVDYVVAEDVEHARLIVAQAYN